jgi:Rubisco Assembly chaperone C-terminal domain
MSLAERIAFVSGTPHAFVREKVLPFRGCRSRVRHSAPSLVLPREDRRAAEIKRLMTELELLKSQKIAQENVRHDSQQRANRVDDDPLHTESLGSNIQMGDDQQATQATERPPVLAMLGKHNQGSRFCSVSTLDGKDFAPRIVAVPGRVPEVDPMAVRNAPRLGGDGFDGELERGVVAWTTVPREYGGEIVPLPSSEVLGSAVDPVGLRVSPGHIGLSVANTKDALLVIDRDPALLDFDNIKVYAWDIDGQVHIGWFKNKPSKAEARCLGRVLCVFVEEDKNTRNEKSCWLEADEVF